MAAYNGYVGTGDWNVVALHKAEPGDTYLVHAGLYKGNRRNYVDEYGLTFDGTYLLTAKGTPEKPITIKAAGDGEVIFDGDGAFRLFDVMAADYHIFEGLTIRNAEVAFWAGVKDVAGAKGLDRPQQPDRRRRRRRDDAVRRLEGFLHRRQRLHRPRRSASRARLGRARPTTARTRSTATTRSRSTAQATSSRTTPSRSSTTASPCARTACPDANPDDRAVAIDIYNNDIHVTGDDFIEADGGVHNIRVMRNRGVNAAHTGLSAQPIFGGPAYYIRNIVYNTPVALKFSNPAGVIVYHNTIIAENRTAQRVSNAHFRNNLFLGTERADRHLGARRTDGVLDVRLRRLPAERGREGAVHVVRTETRRDGGLRRAAEPGTGLRDARGPGEGDRRGNARHRGGLRHLRVAAASAAAGLVPARPAVRGREPELHAEGGRQGRRRRRASAERQRRLFGQGAGPGRARSRARRRPSTVQGG